MAVAAAMMLLLGPAAYHRLADQQDRRGRLRYSVGLKLAGMALLALSISCAVFVVGRFIFDDTRRSCMRNVRLIQMSSKPGMISPFTT
jgi:Family of unknown function (DUF6328)